MHWELQRINSIRIFKHIITMGNSSPSSNCDCALSGLIRIKTINSNDAAPSGLTSNKRTN